MSETDESSYLSPSVQRATRLLRHIGEGDRVTNMARTARALGINRTTLLRLVHTLEADRFIEARGDGMGYRLGSALIGLAVRGFFSDDLMEVGSPVVARLSESLGLAAHLGVLDGREVVYVIRHAPNHALVSNVRLGSRLPAHAAVMGRIMLAHMPAERVAALYADVALAAATEHTPVTLGQLQARIAADRQDGLAWSDGFFEPHISSVAACVFDAAGQPVASINVSGQNADFVGPVRRGQIGRAVSDAAADISLRLGWTGAATRTYGEVA